MYLGSIHKTHVYEDLYLYLERKILQHRVFSRKFVLKLTYPCMIII